MTSSQDYERLTIRENIGLACIFAPLAITAAVLLVDMARSEGLAKDAGPATIVEQYPAVSQVEKTNKPVRKLER